MNVKDMISLGKMMNNLKTEEKPMFTLIKNDDYIEPKTLLYIYNNSEFQRLIRAGNQRKKVFAAVFNSRPLPLLRFKGEDIAIATAYKVFREEYTAQLERSKGYTPALNIVVGGQTESEGVRALRANMRAYDRNQKRIKSENDRTNRSITRRL